VQLTLSVSEVTTLRETLKTSKKDLRKQRDDFRDDPLNPSPGIVVFLDRWLADLDAIHERLTYQNNHPVHENPDGEWVPVQKPAPAITLRHATPDEIRKAVANALAYTGGSVRQAALHLGIARCTLYGWIRTFGIPIDEPEPAPDADVDTAAVA
jgi:transcriptional regulator with GAF, ATPase, and Fis domain